MSGPQVFLNIIPRETTLKTKMIGDSAFSDQSHAYKFQVQEDVLGYPISTGSWFILPESNIAANIVLKPQVGSFYDIIKRFGKFSITESEAPAKADEEPADQPADEEPAAAKEKEEVQGGGGGGEGGGGGQEEGGQEEGGQGGQEGGGGDIKGDGEQMGGDPDEPAADEPEKEEAAEGGQ